LKNREEGITFAILREEGNTPVEIDRLKM